MSGDVAVISLISELPASFSCCSIARMLEVRPWAESLTVAERLHSYEIMREHLNVFAKDMFTGVRAKCYKCDTVEGCLIDDNIWW